VRLWGGADVGSVRVRILAWPGWLDNSGSFDTLAPLLAAAGCSVAAVDPPGCGRSAHRPAWCAYHDWEEAMLMMTLLRDGLRWLGDDDDDDDVHDDHDDDDDDDARPVVLMGHSRGGNLLPLAAAAWPELIAGLINLDGALTLAGHFPMGQVRLAPAQPSPASAARPATCVRVLPASD
jgi:alpha-beta hydrolase superfamily lysophospholipase